MLRFFQPAAIAGVAGLLLGLAGCADSPAPAAAGDAYLRAKATSDHSADSARRAGASELRSDHSHHRSSETVSLPGHSGREATAAQSPVCPVSGKVLGSVGAPEKVRVLVPMVQAVTLKDKDVWICCGQCKDALRKQPKRYLAGRSSPPTAPRSH